MTTTTTDQTQPDSADDGGHIVTVNVRATTRTAAAALKNGLALYVANVTDADDRYTEATVTLETPGNTPADGYVRSVAQAVVDEQERRRPVIGLAFGPFSRSAEPCGCEACTAADPAAEPTQEADEEAPPPDDSGADARHARPDAD